MANFVVCVDPHEERRRIFSKDVAPNVHLLPGLTGGTVDAGVAVCQWAAGPHTPITIHQDAFGCAVIWGLAFASSADRPTRAAEFDQAWHVSGPAPPPPLDGYHAAVAIRGDGRIAVSAETLGLFPLYYWSDGEILLAGSSAELFHHHPGFKPALDIQGLAGILLTMTTFAGRTVLQGVRRLAAGHALIRRADGTLVEIRQYSVPFSDQYCGLPYSALIKVFDDALSDATARHLASTEDHALLLSGGLDSRTVAGYLARSGRRPRALTYGRPFENEMRFARRVAATLGFDHYPVTLSPEDHDVWAEHHARWTHLASGFHSIEYWQAHEQLRTHAPRLVTGYLLDAVAGGSHVDWCVSSGTHTSAKAFITRLHGRAGSPQSLRELFADAAMSRAIQEVEAKLESTFRSLGPTDAQRAWRFDLGHRQRFHVGWILWANSFGSWPISIANDQALLACMAGMPVSAFAERRLQRDLLCARFPQLAELPLDRTTDDASPLIHTPRSILEQRLRWRLQRPIAIVSKWGMRRERHHFKTWYDYDGPAWRRIRQRTATIRPPDGLFVAEKLAGLLGVPDARMASGDFFTDHAERFLIHGFLLWASQHAAMPSRQRAAPREPARGTAGAIS